MQSYPDPNTVAGDSGGGGSYYSSTAGQQPGLLQTSAESLQITAQLSRGIAPIMSANAGSGTAIPENQDTRSQLQGNVNHNSYSHDQQVQVSHLVQGGHGSLDHGGAPYAQESNRDNRRRSKVSRACDECRRKKIRCDATGESGDEQCSSCKRVGTRCQFSRVPLKRGPSKGYIKELADRLHTLEQQVPSISVNTNDSSPYLARPDSSYRHASDDFSPPPSSENPSRKRRFSLVSPEQNSAYLPQKSTSGWPTPQDPTPRHLPHPSAFIPSQSNSTPSQNLREIHYSPNGTQLHSPLRTAVEQPPRRQSSSFEGMAPVPMRSEPLSELEEAVLDAYYQTIHPTYPILPDTKAGFSSMLTHCTVELRDAFFQSLHAAIRPLTSSSQPEQQQSKTASQLINSLLDNVSYYSFTYKLVYLQALIFLAIEADGRALNATGRVDESARSYRLGSAVGFAYQLQLHVHKIPDNVIENSHESAIKLGRKIWWILAIMDKFHASGVATPSLIPDANLVFYSEDASLLGDALYNLTRLAIALGHGAVSAQISTDDLPPTAGLLLLSGYCTFRGELARIVESFPLTLYPPSKVPHVHISWWYMQILAELRAPEAELQRMMDATANLVSQIAGHNSFVSPLTYHGTVLATLALFELTGYEKTREESGKLMDAMLELPLAYSTWTATVRQAIMNKKQKLNSATVPASTAAASTAVQGLQRLADLATATEEDREIPITEVPRVEGDLSLLNRPKNNFTHFHVLREQVRTGYLNALAEQAAN